MSSPDRPDSNTFRRREVSRELAEARREAARDARQAARDSAREHRDAAREHREAARAASRDAREAIRDIARDTRAAGRQDAGEPGTRTRIQKVALELFTEHGYEATSLREIAERLGVTKAALYYHFNTKDEIIQSLVDDQAAMVDELIKWGEQQPRSQATRQEFVRRYSSMLRDGNHVTLMRFFERNQSSMQQHKAGSQMRERIRRMQDLLTEPDAPPPKQIRCALAIFALHSTWLTVRDPEITDDQRRAAALEVALGLID